MKAVRAYYVNGTLLKSETKCEASVPLFSNRTIQQVIAPLAEVGKRELDIVDDTALLAAMKRLSVEFGKRTRL